MAGSDIQTPLRLLAEGYPLPVAAAADRARAEGPVRPVAPVQPVLAEVEAELANGRFRVIVDGQRFELALPAGTRVGARVPVTLPAHAQAEAAASESAPATVSAAGRLVSMLAPPAPGEGRPGTIAAPDPLLPAAPPQGETAAGALRDAVALSGLFYESHQAQWVAGERSLAQLRLEPQARFAAQASPQAPTAPLATPAQASMAPQPGAQPPSPKGAPATALLLSPASAHAQLPAPKGVDPHSLPLVQQQLAALDSGSIAWQGQVWPGHWLEWTIEERQAEAREPDAPLEWQTALRLQLPRLGEVSASLVLAANGLRLTVRAASDHSAAELRGHQGTLEQGLAAAGIALLGLTVKPHAEP